MTAAEAPRFEVTASSGSFSASQSVKWKWIRKAPNVVVLVSELTLQSPQIAEYDNVRTKAPTKGSLKGDTLTLRLSSLSEKVLLTGSRGKLLLTLSGTFESDRPVLEKNCKTASIALRPEIRPVPFFVGIACTRENDVLGATLSFPKQAKLENSTLFETLGKGEPWRFYELPKVKLTSGEIGRFSLEYRGKTYQFVLEAVGIETARPVEEKPDRIVFAAGAGLSMLGISGPDIDASDMKPGLVVRVPHYSVWKGLGLGLDVDLGVPLGTGPSAISFFQLDFYGAYEVALGKRSSLRPRVGYVVLNQSHLATEIGLSSNQVSLGLGSAFRLGEKFHLLVSGMTFGLFSPVVKPHLALEAGLYFKRKQTMGYGLLGRFQTMSAVSESGVSRSLRHIGISLMVAF